MTRVLSELDFLGDQFEWDLERYHAAIAAGVLTEDDRLELIHGKLINKMPISEDHAGVVELLTEYFYERFGFKYRLRSENPVPILPRSEPEPDFVVARKLPGKRKPKHPKPSEIYLIIEVAHSTLPYDRKVKGPIYASAGIPEYWIVNLKSRKLEVHLLPDKAEAAFSAVTIYGAGDTFISPFAGKVSVIDLLPFAEEE